MQERTLFSLTPVQVNQFARENLKAMEFLNIATQDYIAARCCLINGLFSGLVLSAQAVEKYLKAYNLFLTPSKNTRKLSHKVQDLAAEIYSLDPGLELSPHRELIKRLEAHYQTRYPDNLGASTSQSTGEIHEIDTLIILVNKQMPIPLEVKLRSGLYSRLFHGKARGYDSGCNDEYWLLRDNRALSIELQEIVGNCNALEKFLENLRQQRLHILSDKDAY